MIASFKATAIHVIRKREDREQGVESRGSEGKNEKFGVRSKDTIQRLKAAEHCHLKKT